MRTPVSIQRCAEYLGIQRKGVLHALDLGVVRHGRGEGKVVPREVFEALAMDGRLMACPCCGRDVRDWLVERPEDDEEGA